MTNTTLILFTLLVIQQIGDAVSTFVILNLGGKEGNFLITGIAAIVKNLKAAIILEKIIAVVGAAVSMIYGLNLFQLLLVLLYVAILINNVKVVSKQRAIRAAAAAATVTQ